MSDFITKNKLRINTLLLILILLNLFGIAISYHDSDGQSTIDIHLANDGSSVTTYFVDVSGAVLTPGLYELSEPLRVGEIIELAGGLTSDVDLQWVHQNFNQASKLTDEQKIYVPFASEDKPQEDYSLSGQETTAVSLISINNSSQAELLSLPGVGDKTAQLIIEGRPYAEVDDLLEVKGIGVATLAKLQNLISI